MRFSHWSLGFISGMAFSVMCRAYPVDEEGLQEIRVEFARRALGLNRVLGVYGFRLSELMPGIEVFSLAGCLSCSCRYQIVRLVVSEEELALALSEELKKG